MWPRTGLRRLNGVDFAVSNIFRRKAMGAPAVMPGSVTGPVLRIKHKPVRARTERVAQATARTSVINHGHRADQGIVMPKMKTNRAAAKRFRKTASGKFKCGHAFKSHILTKKSTKRKRGLRATNHVRAEDAGRVQRMLPYL